MWAWSDQAGTMGFLWDKEPPPSGSGTNILMFRCGH
jgi:hypothetical protein